MNTYKKKIENVVDITVIERIMHEKKKERERDFDDKESRGVS